MEHDFSEHPIESMLRTLRLINGHAWIYFSIYRYAPQDVRDDRRVFRMSHEELSVDWLGKAISALRPEEELAINSTVKIGAEELHIPMIDFAGIGPDHFSAMRAVFGVRVGEEFDFYSSGRSFHAYGRIGLMRQNEWIRFMGKLLLCNMKNMPMVVDQRWIGHRLLGGYSALRWSKNSSRHRVYPTLVPRIEDFVGLTRRDKLVS